MLYRISFAVFVGFAAFALGLAGCGDDDPATGGDGGSDASANDGATRDAVVVDGRVVDGSVELSCEDMHYFASGELCESCSFGCECEDDFPISLAACTEDGCVIDGDCEAICQVGLRRALECADVYTAPVANGESCSDASVCKSGSCIEGKCAAWKPAWHKTFSASTNNAVPHSIETDGVGVRVQMFSNDGINFGNGSVEGVVVLALDSSGETRWSTPVPHTQSSVQIAAVGEDTIIFSDARQQLDVGDLSITPTGDGDYFAARISSTGEVKWAHHFSDSRQRGSMVVAGARVLVTFAAEDETEQVVFVSLNIDTGIEQWTRTLTAEPDLKTAFGNGGYDPGLSVFGDDVVSFVRGGYGEGIGGVKPLQPGSLWISAALGGSELKAGTFDDIRFSLFLGQDQEGRAHMAFNGPEGVSLPGATIDGAGGIFRATWDGTTFVSPEMVGSVGNQVVGAGTWTAVDGEFENVIVWGEQRQRIGLARRHAVLRINAEGEIDRRLIFRATGSKPPRITTLEVGDDGTVYFGVRAKNPFFLDDVEYPGHAGSGEIAYIFAMEN